MEQLEVQDLAQGHLSNAQEGHTVVHAGPEPGPLVPIEASA